MRSSSPSSSTSASSPGRRPATRAVHAGRPARRPDAPFNEPVTLASTYVAGGDLEYGRYGNPTWSAFEEALASLEDESADTEGAAEPGPPPVRCLAFASGLAALSTVLDLVGSEQVVVAPRHAYNGTVMQLGDLEARGRIKTRLVDITDTAAVIAACDDAALVLLESPTNPAMEIADLPAIIAGAHGAGARVVVDNTFATPLLQQPLSLGADLVLHSATKYIAGHSDVQMGALLTRDPELFDVLKTRRDLTGAVPGPFEAWLALRGLRTLALRVERAQANATVLADRLGEHPAVAEVRYPGFGGMIAVVLIDVATADALVSGTELWVHATSLGGVESSLERRRRWASEPATIPDSLVRLSVGIEDVEDLWEDLSAALG